MELQIAGLVVLALGVVLIVLGIIFSWSEYKANKTLGATEFVEALAGLVRALAGQPRSVVCFTFGVLLVFLGGVMAGASALTA